MGFLWNNSLKKKTLKTYLVTDLRNSLPLLQTKIFPFIYVLLPYASTKQLYYYICYHISCVKRDTKKPFCTIVCRFDLILNIVVWMHLVVTLLHRDCKETIVSISFRSIASKNTQKNQHNGLTYFSALLLHYYYYIIIIIIINIIIIIITS